MDRQLIKSVGLMVVAMSLIPLGDSAGKLLVGSYGADPGFVAFARFAVGAMMIAVLLGFRVDWRIWSDWRVWLRAALIAGGIVCILTALQTVPIASVFGAFFVGPIFSYLLSVRLLGEPAIPARLALLGVGFIGVLLVVRPGFGMQPGLGWAVVAGLLYGAYLTASRWIGGIAGPRQLMLTQTVIGTILLVPFGIASAMPVLTAPSIGLLLVSGMASALGNLLLVVAYRQTSATVLAPFVYFQLVAATGLGLLIFGEWPDLLTMIGLLILIASGFATLTLRR